MASVFFSYSHKDEALRDQLETHLALLKNQGKIDAWYDRRIIAGNEIDDSVFSKMESADIILLLISSDFISSTYCYSREMMKAMEMHEAGRARVIPVILRHCEWQSAPFGKLMAAPRDGRPITSWPDKDEAFSDVAKQVRLAVESLTSRSESSNQRVRLHPVTVDREQDVNISKPRSGNLRLKKEFTEEERDYFLRATFDYVCNFFEGSLDAIKERNHDVTGVFDRIDSRRMAAVIYRSGAKIAECSVRLDGLGGRNMGVAFSYDASANNGSFNEILNVEASEQTLYLKAMGMSNWGSERDK
ncbi:MAG TPA: toll/interleukin-1 receptor domain-containing protein [Burkholderiaceae bacterium]|nr:toll/interleukin-1 receptor domain-containing protein [Burkholderiaceae bacterium]